MKLPEHGIRPLDARDRAYVIETWLKSYRSSPFANQLPDFAYWSRFGHVGIVEELCNRDDLRTVAAYREADSPWVYGWALANDPGDGQRVLHYVFVRYEYRGFGFGKLLLRELASDGADLVVSHLTPDFSRWLAADRNVRFVNPYRKGRE